MSLLHKLSTSVTGGAILIAFFSILSKIAGLLRDRMLAANFGAGAELDIYFAAFKLPDLIFNVLVLGALSSAFVPIFQRAWKADQSEALNLANSVLNILWLITGGLALIFAFFATQLTPYIVPGFTSQALDSTVHLTRIMLISIFFFTYSNILGGVLNSWNRFFSFALSSLMYNLGIIVGIVAFYPRLGLDGLAWGVVLGAFLHLIVQLIEARNNGWHYHKIILWSAEVKKVFTLMLPRTVGLAGFQLNLVVITIIASTLTAGSLSVFNLAYNLQSFPISIFGISLAIAAYPTIAQFFNQQDVPGFVKFFSWQFRRILFFLLPISILFVVLRAQIVRVILGSGSFNWPNTIATANTVGLFAVSIFAQGLIPLCTRAFYAQEDTKTPVLISFVSMAVNIVLSLILVQYYAVLGLAMAFSLANMLNLLLLIWALKFRMGDLNDSAIIGSALRIFAVAIFSGFIANRALIPLSLIFNLDTFVGIFLQGLLAGIIGLSVYILLTLIFNFPEVTFAKRYYNRFIKFLRP